MDFPNHDSLDYDPIGSAQTRRHFLSRMGLGVMVMAGALAGAPRLLRAAEPEHDSLPLDLLEKSSFVYISPLLPNGKESRCHAEVWFAWIDDNIVVTVAKERWKATALDRGLDRARIWVGDHGRWKTTFGGRNEKFASAPSFFARAERVEDDGMIERLLTVYARKYPNEIATWRDKMRSGDADGSRILIRYRPQLERSR